MSAVDLDRFRETPLNQVPFEYLVVPGFVRGSALPDVHAAFPVIARPGCYPAGGLRQGPAFAALVKELTGAEMRAAVEAKFDLCLRGRPTVVTVRGRCGPRDGRIHTDLPGKIITLLLYLNPTWENVGGQLRLLRSATDLEDVVTQVPPLEGTLLAFRRSDTSFHGHAPFVGERRVIQVNWVTRRHLWALRYQGLKDRLARFSRPWRSESPSVAG